MNYFYKYTVFDKDLKAIATYSGVFRCWFGPVRAFNKVAAHAVEKHDTTRLVIDDLHKI
jgi:hypothetical protein